MTKIIHLSWISHHTAFSSIIPNFRINNTFCDVTVSCNGNYFPAHRLILSTFSEYFREILENVPCRHPFIVIQDCEVEDLKDLLDFIYVGEASVSSERIASFLKAATNLKIKGLGLSDESNTSLADFQDKMIKLGEKIEETGVTSNIQNINDASTSGIKRGRGRPKSKRKIEEDSSKSILRDKKQIRTEETKSELQEQKVQDTGIKSVLKNSRVVIENCPQAIKMCRTLNFNSKNKLTNDGYNDATNTTGMENDDDFFSDDFSDIGNPRSEVDMAILPIKEEPFDYGSQLDSDKNEGSPFSIENVYSVRDKPGPLSTRVYPSSSLSSSYWNSNQDFLQNCETPAFSREDEETPGPSCPETSGPCPVEDREAEEERMEFVRVKLEPFDDDICCDEATKDETTEDIENPLGSLGPSVYDFLTTELGTDSMSDKSQGPSHETEKLSKRVKNMPNGTEDLCQVDKNLSKSVRNLALKSGRRPTNKMCKTKKLLKCRGRLGISKKKYSCELCMYKTGFTQNLRVHMRTHTGEKPYMCTFCSYKSTQKNALDKHLQTHKEKKLIKCESCSFETKRRSEIEEHRKTHTDSLTYRCEYCSFYTSRNQSLQNHLKKHFRTEENALDSDNSFEPKRKVMKKKIGGPYKSKKRSILRRKMFAIKMKEALKIQQGTVDNGDDGEIMQLGTLKEEPTDVHTEVIGLSGVKDDIDPVDEGKKKKYKKRERQLRGQLDSPNTPTGSGEIFTETNPCRIARQKKLLALSLIKKNFSLSLASGEDGTGATSETSTDGQTSRSSMYKKRKCKLRKKRMILGKKLTSKIKSGDTYSDIRSVPGGSFPSGMVFGSQSSAVPLASNTTMVPVNSSISGNSMMRSSLSRMISVPGTLSSLVIVPGIPGIVSLPSTSRNIVSSVPFVRSSGLPSLPSSNNIVSTLPLVRSSGITSFPTTSKNIMSTLPLVRSSGLAPTYVFQRKMTTAFPLNITSPPRFSGGNSTGSVPDGGGTELPSIKNGDDTEPHVQRLRIVSFESLREVPTKRDDIPDNSSVISDISGVSSVSEGSADSKADNISPASTGPDVPSSSDTIVSSEPASAPGSSGTLNAPTILNSTTAPNAHTCSTSPASSSSSAVLNSTLEDASVIPKVSPVSNRSREGNSVVLNEYSKEIC